MEGWARRSWALETCEGCKIWKLPAALDVSANLQVVFMSCHINKLRIELNKFWLTGLLIAKNNKVVCIVILIMRTAA